MGFRLGGKGASGRGTHGRIEEHGLHLWMGYYENAFRLLRDCYAELAEHGGHPWCFEDAFTPADFNAAMDLSPTGVWRPWKVEFPRMPGLPGDPEPPRLGVADGVDPRVALGDVDGGVLVGPLRQRDGAPVVRASATSIA